MARAVVATSATIYTKQYVAQLVADAAKTIGSTNNETTITLERAQQVKAELQAIATTVSSDTTVVPSDAAENETPTSAAAVATQATNAANTVGDKITAATVNVTVTGITGAVADPAVLEKNAALAGQTITIKDAEGATLTTATLASVTMSTALVEDADYTYANGVITFKGDKTATTDIAIQVAAAVVEDTYDVTINKPATGVTVTTDPSTTTGLADGTEVTITLSEITAGKVAVVKNGETVVNATSENVYKITIAGADVTVNITLEDEQPA